MTGTGGGTQATHRQARHRVAALTVVIAGCAIGITQGLPATTVVGQGHLWASVGVMAAFALSEKLIFHVEARNEAVSYTPTELTLAVGLLFINPLQLVLARVLGGLVGIAVWRRQPLFKLSFNLAHFAFETAVAIAVFRMIASPGSSAGSLWAGLLVALSLALLLGGVLVASAIAQFEGSWPSQVAAALKNAPVFHLPAAIIAASVSVPITVDPWLGLVALTPAPVMWLVIRSHGALMHRYSDLTSVHDFSRHVGATTDLADIASTAADRIAQNSRAGSVMLRLWGSGGIPVDARVGSVTCADLFPDTPADRHWEAVFTRGAGTPILRGDDPALAPLDLQEMGCEIGVVAVIADDAGPLGIIALGDRQGVSTTFDDDDLGRLTAMLQQLAVVVRKGHFHAQIQYDATHDQLTGLPNRGYFEAWIRKSIAERPRHAVLLIDLDRFKEINDAFGHHAGDTVLIEVADRLRRVVGKDGLAARFGGDEFAIVTPAADAAAAQRLAEAITEALEQPFDIGPATVAIAASIGISIGPDHASLSSELLRLADIAMYDAKARRIPASLYRDDLAESDTTRLTLLADLRGMLRAEELEVYYQPQIDLDSRKVIGAEALARWNHPEVGFINPELFVGLAEQAGLIEELTRQVLTKAAEQAAQWERRGFPINVSVNISAQSLLDERLEPLVRGALERSNLAPQRLMLEITETTMMGDPERTARTLDRLAALGVALSVDDFGTGYSSLSNLRQLPVSELKIDRGFITELMDDDDDVIVRSTVELGHNMGLVVVAEGVEDEAMQQRLRALGCDVAQGYGISRPLAAQAFLAWLVDHERDFDRTPLDRALIGLGVDLTNKAE